MPPKLLELREEAAGLDSQLQKLASHKAKLMKELGKYIRDGSVLEEEIKGLEKSYSFALLSSYMMEQTDGKPLVRTLRNIHETRTQSANEHSSTITRIQKIQDGALNDAVSKVQVQCSKLQSEKSANESIKQKQDKKLEYLESVLLKSKAESEHQTYIVEKQVQTFSMAMMQTQEELQKARDTVKQAQAKNKHYLRVARASEHLKPDHERKLLKLPAVFNKPEEPEKLTIPHTEEFLNSAAGRFTGAHSMLFATEKARDAFEKWAMFKKRRASMSDTAVDVAKLRETAQRQREARESANERAFQEWAADKQRQDETNKKDLKEMFAQMQFTSPNRPTTQQRKFSRSSSDSSAVLAKRNSVSPFSSPQKMKGSGARRGTAVTKGKAPQRGASRGGHTPRHGAPQGVRLQPLDATSGGVRFTPMPLDDDVTPRGTSPHELRATQQAGIVTPTTPISAPGATGTMQMLNNGGMVPEGHVRGNGADGAAHSGTPDAPSTLQVLNTQPELSAAKFSEFVAADEANVTATSTPPGSMATTADENNPDVMDISGSDDVAPSGSREPESADPQGGTASTSDNTVHERIVGEAIREHAIGDEPKGNSFGDGRTESEDSIDGVNPDSTMAAESNISDEHDAASATSATPSPMTQTADSAIPLADVGIATGTTDVAVA